MTTMPSNPRPARKISQKGQQSVDEILKLVQDQTRKISLSGADYRTQQRIERSPSTQTDDDTNSEFLENSNRSVSCSEVSYSPPSTQQSLFSWEYSGTTDQRKSNCGDLAVSKLHRGLPPLEPSKTTKQPPPPPPRPPARLASRGAFDDADVLELKRPVRPMSARGERTLPRSRGLTT